MPIKQDKSETKSGVALLSNKNSSRFALAISIVILAVALAWGLQNVGQGISRRGSDTVSVRGTAKRNMKADRAVWSLTISQSADSAAKTIAGVSDGVDLVVKFMKSNNVKDEAILLGSITSYSIKEELAGNYTGRILSYEARRQVIIRMNDVDKVAALAADLGELLAMGINIDSEVEYYLEALDSLRPELLAEAMSDAKLRAETLLDAVGSKIGEVRSVSSGPFQVNARDSSGDSGGYYETRSIEKTVIASVLVEFATNN
ncbi:MAG: DUF541 domain-containing protein [Actinobacteria bacterium]|uniref:Unannotated protein n=2 Tax=freshwater metagenome TaxID=449393 RepID=A0A6J6U5U1_9ZZZZ|nr:DUF541 domain-containing protein [Actinomycetota bacterium]